MLAPLLYIDRCCGFGESQDEPGGVKESHPELRDTLSLSKEDIYKLARNSFEASFLPEQQKELLINKLDEYMELNK